MKSTRITALFLLFFLLATSCDTGQLGEAKLIEAAWRGDAKKVVALLEKGVNVNAGDRDDRRALMAAARSGNNDVVQILLEHGAHVNATHYYGVTALSEAARRERCETMRLLLDHGVDMGVEGNSKALVYVANPTRQRRNMKEIFYLLLEKGAHVDSIDGNGNTSLIYAVRRGDAEMVKALLEHGANLDFIGDGAGMVNQSALMEAALRRDKNIMQILLDSGADVNLQSKGGWTALKWTVRECPSDKEKKIFNGIPTWLHNSSHLEIARFLIKHGADVNAADSYGNTALVLAVAWCTSEMVQFLVGHGSNVNVTGSKGLTPLIIATRNGKKEIFHVLLENGADVDAVDGYGGTALIYAAVRGDTEMVRTLLAKGADVNIKSKDDTVDYFFGVDFSYMWEINPGPNFGDMFFRHLDEAGEQIYTRRKEEKPYPGMTALMKASERGYEDIVRVLLDNGADANVVATDGSTAKKLAAAGKHMDIVNILEQAERPEM